MSERVHISSLPISAPGFSLVELLTAMALSLLLFAMTFSLVQQLDNTADVVGSAADVNENVRAAINMVSRDLSTAGQNIPVGGIPLPYGGTATAIKLPYPTTSNVSHSCQRKHLVYPRAHGRKWPRACARKRNQPDLDGRRHHDWGEPNFEFQPDDRVYDQSPPAHDQLHSRHHHRLCDGCRLCLSPDN